jgi:hypothetical protein
VQHLLLEKNLLSGPLPDAWNQMAALTVVYLNSNKLNGTLPASWGTGALANLDHLDVANNEHTGILPPSWGGLTGLYALYLQNNTRLSGTIPCSWSSMGSKGQSPLTQLGVGSTGLTGCFPSAGMLAASDWVREAPIWVIDVPGKMDVPGVKGVRGEWCRVQGRGCMQAGEEGEVGVGGAFGGLCLLAAAAAQQL